MKILLIKKKLENEVLMKLYESVPDFFIKDSMQVIDISNNNIPYYADFPITLIHCHESNYWIYYNVCKINEHYYSIRNLNNTICKLKDKQLELYTLNLDVIRFYSGKMLEDSLVMDYFKLIDIPDDIEYTIKTDNFGEYVQQVIINEWR